MFRPLSKQFALRRLRPEQARSLSQLETQAARVPKKIRAFLTSENCRILYPIGALERLDKRDQAASRTLMAKLDICRIADIPEKTIRLFARP